MSESMEKLKEKAVKEYEVVYNEIYERYKFKDERFLKRITQSNGHTEIAERVASDILNSDRAEYYQAKQIKKENMSKRQKRDSLSI
ncbi:MAG: hypothetical protein IJ167_09490 [Lachnospiraceae bacterium]|nr:hypothetical protein [Lachnospiraceae bacterium]